jgi:hypothetical protein
MRHGRCDRIPRSFIIIMNPETVISGSAASAATTPTPAAAPVSPSNVPAPAPVAASPVAPKPFKKPGKKAKGGLPVTNG